MSSFIKKNKTAVIIGVVAVVSVGAYFGYRWWKNRKKEEPKEEAPKQSLMGEIVKEGVGLARDVVKERAATRAAKAAATK
jgi:predicted negative regulator of RcsB-dependent stress response